MTEATTRINQHIIFTYIHSKTTQQNLSNDVHYTLTPSLCFENGEDIGEDWDHIFVLQNPNQYEYAVSKSHPKCEIRYRIEKVSTAFQGQRFSVLVKASPAVTDTKKLNSLKGLEDLDSILTTPTLVKAKPKRQSKTKENRARLSDAEAQIDSLNTQVVQLKELLGYCMLRLDELEKQTFPTSSRLSTLDPRPVVLGRSISERLGRSISDRSDSSLPEFPLPGIPHNDLSRMNSDLNNSTATTMISTAAVMPPGPPTVVRSISKDIEKLKGAPPTFERMSSSDGNEILRLNTTDLQLLIDMSTSDVAANEEEEEEESPKKKKRKKSTE